MADQTAAEGGYKQFRRNRPKKFIEQPVKGDTYVKPNMGTKKRAIHEYLGHIGPVHRYLVDISGPPRKMR